MGVSWELLRTSGSTKEGVQIRLGTLLGLVCSLLAAENGLGSVVGLFWARFGCSRGPLKGRNRLDGCQTGVLVVFSARMLKIDHGQFSDVRCPGRRRRTLILQFTSPLAQFSCDASSSAS